MLTYYNRWCIMNFTHLWGYKRTLESAPAERHNFCKRCMNRIKEDFPEFYDVAEYLVSWFSVFHSKPKSFLTTTHILSSCYRIHIRTHKISYPDAPSSYAEKLAKGEIEGKKSARGKPIKRGKCQFLLDFIFPPLEEVSLSHQTHASNLN